MQRLADSPSPVAPPSSALSLCRQCGLLTCHSTHPICQWCLALNADTDDLQDARTEAALRFGMLPDDESAPGWPA